MLFEWDELKNEKLKRERGISFEEIALVIESKFIDRIPNPKYPLQQLYIIEIKNYAWTVVTEQRKEKLRFVTAYPSRTHTKTYLWKQN